MAVAPNRIKRGYTNTRYRRLVRKGVHKTDLKSGRASRSTFNPDRYRGGSSTITPLSAYSVGAIRNAERQKRIELFGKIDAEGRPVQNVVSKRRKSRRKVRPRRLQRTVKVTHTPAKVTTLKLRRVKRTVVKKRKVYGPVRLNTKKKKRGKKVRFGKKKRPKSKKRVSRRKKR